MPVKLSTTLSKISSVPNSTNASLLDELYAFMQETGASESHCNNTLKTAIAFAHFLESTETFYDIGERKKIIAYLDTKMKDSLIDPEQRWITTWNDYLGDLKYLFRWLHNYKLKIKQGLPGVESIPTPSEWLTPGFIQIKKKKSRRSSSYSQSEIWDLDELKIIMKYEPSKRNKAAIALMWDLNARNHEVILLKIKHIRLKERYGEGEIPYQAKTGSGPILLTFSFPYVRDWLNEHPFRNSPDARLVCNLINGSPIRPDALWTIMKQLRARITRMVENDAITDKTEKESLRVLLTTKKFNPYCFRHSSSISHDSDFLPDYALKKKVRWSMNSKQPSRYIKARLSDNLKKTILIHNGIITENEGKPKTAILECARCQKVCALDSKYCISCSYPLTPMAYEEIKAAENERIKNLEQKYEQDMKAVRQQMSSMFTMLEKLTDQNDVNIVASTLYQSGQLKVRQ